MKERLNRWPVVLFLLLFSVYLRTMVTEVYTADSGELTSVAAILGIPHPTGYPLYNLLLKAFYLFVPFGSIAWRAALLSAVAAAVAAVLFEAVARRFMPRIFSFTGGVILGLSYTFWSQAVIQEVYALHFCLLLWTVLAVLRFRENSSYKRMFRMSLALGLTLTHHLMSILVVPAWALLLFFTFKRRSLKAWISAAVFFLIGAGVLLYLPLRTKAGTPFTWIPCDQWRSFLFHVTGRQFQMVMFNATMGEMLHRAGDFISKCVHQWPWALSVLALPGVYAVWRKSCSMAVSIILWFLLTFIFIINYAIIDIEVYYVQAYIPLLLAACSGAYLVSEYINHLGRRCGWIVPALLIVCAAAQLPAGYHDNDRSRNFYAYDYGVNVYNSLPPDTLLVTQGWSSPFVFNYMTYVLHYRPDVHLVVDYRGTVIRDHFEKNDARPVCSTVPVEIQTLTPFSYRVMGVVYLLTSGSGNGMFMPSAEGIIRKRSMSMSDIFVDYHARGLLSKYQYMAGDGRLAEGRFDEAMERFVRAEAISPDNNLVMNNIAGILFHYGYYREAERFARRSIELDPAFYQAHHNLGNILIREGRFEEAIREFGFRRDQRFALGRAHEALGFSCLKAGRFVRAVEEFQKALLYKPSSENLKLNLCVAYMESNQLDKAKTLLDQLRLKQPDAPDVLNNLGLWHLKKGDPEKAAKVWAGVLKRHPERLDVKVNLAAAHAYMKRWEDAERILREVLARDPENIQALNNMALILKRMDRWPEAIRFWKQSLSVKPDQMNVVKELEKAGCTREEIQAIVKLRSGKR